MFNAAQDAVSIESLEALDKQMKEIALGVGVDSSEEGRSGTYFQVDRSPIYQRVTEMYGGKLEIMSTKDALELYPELMYEHYYWKAVAPDKDKYTALVALQETEGYFIRVLPGQKIDKPIQACLFVSENNITQNVHNVIIMEEGSEANVITGCTIHPKVREGLHAGISEFYVGKGAKLTFTMIHNWAEDFDVRPRTGIVVEEDGTYINNYVMLKPVKSLQSFPVCTLEGDRSVAVFNSIVNGIDDSYIDIGSETQLNGAGTRSEAIARTVSRDTSIVYSRGRLRRRQQRLKGASPTAGHRPVGDRPDTWPSPISPARAHRARVVTQNPRSSPIAARRSNYLMTRCP